MDCYSGNYLSLLDSFLKQSGKDEIPDMVTQDSRFCMNQQLKRLNSKKHTDP